MHAMPWQWSLFCRVVDNFGDAGVCWRLAADLARRGHAVRLYIDDASPLAWMAPGGCPGVEVLPWSTAERADGPGVGDVVIEAFGCRLPDAFLERMARQARAREAASRPAGPIWLNLEYLSAEADVERSHALPSPQWSGPAAGLAKWFFYPGFTRATGGLLREPGLLAERAAFDQEGWLAGQGIAQAEGERLVSVFAYRTERLPALLAAWQRTCGGAALHLLVAGGLHEAVGRALAGSRLENLRLTPLPWLSQAAFDRLLWSCDLNLVRGEDSFVRAQWAGRPFVWQIYPQDDGVHHLKLDAFLARFLDGAPLDTADAIRSWWRYWNDADEDLPARAPDAAPWRQLCERWRSALATRPDLSTQLIEFASARR